MKQRAVRDTTIRPRINQLKDLHKMLTNVDINCFFAEHFTGPLAAILVGSQVTFQSFSIWFGTSVCKVSNAKEVIPRKAVALS